MPELRPSGKITDVYTTWEKAFSHHIVHVGETFYVVRSGSSGTSYIVRRVPHGYTCNCPWGQRRPDEDPRSGCSHVLAVFIRLARIQERRMMAWSSLDRAKGRHKMTLDIGDGVYLTME